MDNLATSVVVLGYVLNAKRERALLLYHNGDALDSSYGKYNGLSGRLGPTESVSEAMRRVVMTETLVEPGFMELRGVVHWSGFGRKNESLLGHVFLIHDLHGKAQEFTKRGKLEWVETGRLTSGELPMWAGDEHILPLVLDRQPEPFFGYMPYDHGVPRAWSYERPGANERNPRD